MAIKSIRVKNFKSFKDVEVQLGDFNVLIGANASGKSNFIHLIEFLRDIQRHGLDNAISLQGGPEYVTSLNIGTGENLTLEIVGSPEPYLQPFVVGRSQNRDTELKLAARESRYSCVIGFSTDRRRVSILEEHVAISGTFSFEEKGSVEPHQSAGEVQVDRRGQTTIKLISAGLGNEYEPESWLATSGHSLLLSHSLLLGSLAEGSAVYDFDPKLPKKGTPITGKAELEEDASNLAIVLKRIVEDESARRNLTNLLHDLLPFVTNLDVEGFADKSLLFSLREKFTDTKPIPASFISDGTINVLALIVALYFEKKPIAIFEEAERNVHPHLIPRIVAMMKEASRHKQVIVTTQNPEVVKNVDIADVLLVSRDAEGFSTITRPSEREDVKAFLRNQIGLEELFVENLLPH